VESSNDLCTIVAGGVTLHEAVKASDKLKSLGKAVRVIDAFTVKPIDRETILKSVNATHNRLLVVEDHYPEGLPRRLLFFPCLMGRFSRWSR
jgi:transketolase